MSECSIDQTVESLRRVLMSARDEVESKILHEVPRARAGMMLVRLLAVEELDPLHP
jgi:hypothetical protein